MSEKLCFKMGLKIEETFLNILLGGGGGGYGGGN